MLRPRPLTALLWILLLALAPAMLLAQPRQVEEEDLPEPNVWEQIIPTYVEGEKVFNSRSQPDSLALFDEFLRQVEANQATEEPPDEIHRLVANSVFYRAQVNFNLGKTADVEADLSRLLALDPGFAMDRNLVSSKFAELFDRIKKQTVGSVVFTVDPPDAEVAVGRWKAGADGLLTLPVGTHVVHVTRPGYTSAEQEVAATIGETPTFNVVLERLAAVLTVFTTQEDVEIMLDGKPRGATSLEGGIDPGQGARLVLDDLQPGTYELAAHRDGYRTYKARAQIADLRDYVVGPIDLQPTAGVVVLSNLPAGTAVRANDELVTPVFAAGAQPQLVLSPGKYKLALSHPDLGLFESDVDVADQETETIAVKLRPPIVLLGVLGGDEQSAGKLQSLLASGLSKLDRYAFIDRAATGAPILAAAGIEVSDLRAFAQTGRRQAIPWDKIRAEADQRAKGALYLLAVLADDLLASRAHLFVFPQAPLPARPDLVGLELTDQGIAHFEALLDASVLSDRPILDAVLVDAPTGTGPLVVHVGPSGPAHNAGLTAGDRIVDVDGTAVATAAEVEAALVARVESHAKTGKTVPMQVVSAAGPHQVSLGLGTGPVIVDLRDDDVLYSVAAFELQSEAQNPESLVPKWVVGLNQGVVYLHGGDLQGAIRVLREVKAPEGARLGRGMADYLMGLALAAAGGEYSATAKEFLGKAAADGEARLYHADGPFVAPRAQARLRVLN
ncbi:MAG TPA: PEGA domain-containing protein [Thermoanaerobaculia bacterium]|nr:PEGA domain-containing protein [Thermoanaerobaculia bacterium]